MNDRAASPGRITVREAQVRATRQLEQDPTLQPRAALDARLLLRHTLCLTAAQLLAYPERTLTSDEQHRLDAFLQRRLAHEPVQYITGEQEFYGIPLRVTPAVLIPRPETELLVEAVLSELQAEQSPETRAQPLRIIDVGTGSGAIAIALASALSSAQITAVDISPSALELAHENAARHILGPRIRLLQSDLLADLPEREPPYDAIVSNPPYVAESDRATLAPEVREYEPPEALFAGTDGLNIYRRLIPQARALLRPGGLLAMEFGFGQREPLRSLLAGWSDVRFIEDLQRIPRVVLARS